MIKVKTFPITKCSLIICLYFIVVNCQGPSKEVTVSPQKYVDDKKPYMEFACEAHLDIGDKLSWNITRSKKQEKVALYEELYEKGTKGLDLQWPLTPEDNNTEIFCFKEKTVNGTPSTMKSKNISISFQSAHAAKSREMVWIWPNKTVIVYNDTAPVELACWAWMDTTPKLPETNTTQNHNDYEEKGRFVSWYQIYGSTRPERLIMLQQINNFSYVKLDLWKIFRPMDSGTEIFCAKDTILEDDSTIIGNRSPRMLLIYQEPARILCYPLDECRTLSKLGWMVAAVLVVLAALAVVGVVFAFLMLCFGTKTCESNKPKSN